MSIRALSQMQKRPVLVDGQMVTKLVGTWQIDIKNTVVDKRERHSFFGTKEGADALELDLRMNYQIFKKTGALPVLNHTKKTATFDKLCVEYLEHPDIKNLASYKTSVVHETAVLTWYFGSKTLSSFTQDEIVKFREDIKSRKTKVGNLIGPRTINHYLKRLSALLHFAKDRKYMTFDESPVSKVKRLPTRNRTRVFSLEELATILRACTDKELWKEKLIYGLRLRDSLLLMLVTGLRDDASLPYIRLHSDDCVVSYEKRTMRVRQKGGRMITMPLCNTAIKVLQRYLRPENNAPFNYEKKRAWKKVIEHTKIPEAMIRDLRRTFATILGDTLGVRDLVVSSLLGHARGRDEDQGRGSLGVTGVYLQISDSRLHEAVMLLDQYFEKYVDEEVQVSLAGRRLQK